MKIIKSHKKKVIAVFTLLALIFLNNTPSIKMQAQNQSEVCDEKDELQDEEENPPDGIIITIQLIVTAYAPYDNKSGICNDGNPNKTATGTKPDWGTIAVNPNKFPYGTKFYIPGYGHGIAEDTGGAMRRNSNKIDVYMDTYEEAIAWGKQELDVIVYYSEKEGSCE